VLALVCQQIEAAARDDEAAVKWMHAMLRPLPRRRKSAAGKRGRQGRRGPVPDEEMVGLYDRLVRYFDAVRAQVAEAPGGRALVDPRDRYSQLARWHEPPSIAAERERRRKVGLRQQARALAAQDPALGNVKLLHKILTAPTHTAKDLTVAFLRARAKGFELKDTLERALKAARRERAGSAGLLVKALRRDGRRAARTKR